MRTEETINRICSGFLWANIDDQIYKLGSPSMGDRYQASIIYQEWYCRGSRLGLPNEEDIMDIMYDENLWSDALEEELDVLKKDIEKLKIGLYEMMLQSAEISRIRKGLAKGKFRLLQLENQKSSLDYLTCEFMGRMARNNFLALCNIRNRKDILLIDPEEALNKGHRHFQNIVMARTEAFLEEFQYRALSRCDYWQNIWGTSKESGSLFGVPSNEFSYEQQNLVRWSKIYDNVKEHPESPPNQVFDDDDMFDGWILIQFKNRAQQKQESLLEARLKNNKKATEAGEVFIPVSNPEDARKVYDANSPIAARNLKRRLSLVKEKGTVNEIEMPDTKAEIMMKLNNMSSQRMKNA